MQTGFVRGQEDFPKDVANHAEVFGGTRQFYIEMKCVLMDSSDPIK